MVANWSARRHAQRAVQADHLAVEVRVGDDMRSKGRELLGFTGITIEENGSPDDGIRFEIRVPKGKYRFL